MWHSPANAAMRNRSTTANDMRNRSTTTKAAMRNQSITAAVIVIAANAAMRNRSTTANAAANAATKIIDIATMIRMVDIGLAMRLLL